MEEADYKLIRDIPRMHCSVMNLFYIVVGGNRRTRLNVFRLKLCLRQLDQKSETYRLFLSLLKNINLQHRL